MKKRVITAILALLIFVPIIWAGGLYLEVSVALLAVISVYELFKMKGLSLYSFEGVLSALGAIFLVIPSERWQQLVSIQLLNFNLFYVVVICLLSVTVFSKNTYTFDEVAFPVLVSLYVGMGFQSFVLARRADLVIVFYALFVVWATDIGAYLFGKYFGKNKLAPEVSPNKTREGAIGGILSAVLISVIYFTAYPVKDYFPYSLLTMSCLTILFSIVGQLGDLVESAYKRHYGVKDSGHLLPGHGGILDRFDSLLFVFPLMYVLGIF